MTTCKPKVLIIGSARSGKDTFAEMLCKKANLKFKSSSYFFAEIAFDIFKSIPGFNYRTVQECFDDRGNHRELWKKLMVLYNTPDPSTLASNILKESDVYVGMRTLREYEASKQLFNFIFYVDATKRIAVEDSTFEIPYNKNCMFWIDNNWNLETLEAQSNIAADIVLGKASCKINSVLM